MAGCILSDLLLVGYHWSVISCTRIGCHHLRARQGDETHNGQLSETALLKRVILHTAVLSAIVDVSSMRPRWWILLAVIVISYLAGYSPFGTVLHLTNQVWGSFRTSIGPTGPEDSLVAAVRNVTSDCDQVMGVQKLYHKQSL